MHQFTPLQQWVQGSGNWWLQWKTKKFHFSEEPSWSKADPSGSCWGFVPKPEEMQLSTLQSHSSAPHTISPWIYCRGSLSIQNSIVNPWQSPTAIQHTPSSLLSFLSFKPSNSKLVVTLTGNKKNLFQARFIVPGKKLPLPSIIVPSDMALQCIPTSRVTAEDNE